MTTPVPARRSPDGYVAQRFTDTSTALGASTWVLTYLDDRGFVSVRTLNDDEVAGWPELP